MSVARPMIAEPPPSARMGDAAALLSAVVVVVSFVLLHTTSAILPITWDEGNAINRAAGVAEWARTLSERPLAALSSREIAPRWRYTVEIEGHPALYGALIALGESLGRSWQSPLTTARLGPMALFAVAVGAMFYRLAREYSYAAAVAGTAALITMPRVFAHAHFASFDGPLTSCWILAWASFPAVRRDKVGWRSAAVWGVALGATLSCKFTGWLAPLPFIAYAGIYGDRRCAISLATGLAASVGVFWLLNPRLWHHPLDGTAAFLELNLGRTGTPLDIATTFFGVRYRSVDGLPWYNALVWTCITVPVGTLLLAVVGIAGALRRWARDGHRALILANWMLLLLVKGWPGTPVHDAERLVLPSFAFLAALAGVGCCDLLEWAKSGARRQIFVPLAIVLAYVGSATSLIWYAPQWLSYYNLLIGGLRGADAAGMEATYYWDALDGEVLEWLHTHTAAGEKIEFSAASEENLALMRRWGTLQRDWRAEQPGEYRWRVIQRRPTFWTADDRARIERGTAVFRKTIRPPAWGLGPWRLDVPLVEIVPTE